MLNIRKSIFIVVLGIFLLKNTALQSLPGALKPNIVGYTLAKGTIGNFLTIGILWEQFKEEACRKCISMIFEKQDLLLELLEEINNKENPKEKKILYRKLKFLIKKECSLFKSLFQKDPHMFAVTNLCLLFHETSPPYQDKEAIAGLIFITKFLVRGIVETLAGVSGNGYFLKKLDTWNIEQFARFLVENYETLKEILTEDQTPQESLKLLIEEHYKNLELPKSIALTKSLISCLGFFVSKIIDNIINDGFFDGDISLEINL